MQPETGDDIVDAVLMAAHRVRTATDARLRGDGLSLTRLKVLRLLEPAPMPIGKMSVALTVAPRTMTDVVDGMEGAGLLERSPHPTDRRVVLVCLTEEGRARLETARGQASDVAGRATSAIPPDRRAELIDLLGRIGSTPDAGAVPGVSAGPAVPGPRADPTGDQDSAL